MQIFTVKELAEYLSCSVSSIRNLVRNSSIPCFRIGSKINFKKEAIDSWVCNQELNSVQVNNMMTKEFSRRL